MSILGFFLCVFVLFFFVPEHHILKGHVGENSDFLQLYVENVYRCKTDIA